MGLILFTSVMLTKEYSYIRTLSNEIKRHLSGKFLEIKRFSIISVLQ